MMRHQLRLLQLLIWSKSLDACNREIAREQELNKALEATVVAAIGDNNKFAKYLMKVFKKKIKRRKKPESRAATG